jgi:hypothetical protein
VLVLSGGSEPGDDRGRQPSHRAEAPIAGAKSPVEGSCGCNGKASDRRPLGTCGTGGMMTERTWALMPVVLSTRGSFILGSISNAPATVWTLRLRACPFRVTTRRPSSSRSSASSAKTAGVKLAIDITVGQ